MADGDYAYCVIADVQAITQVGAYSGSTVPTSTEVQDFMQRRSAEVYGWLVEIMGDSAPGPTLYSTTIDNGTDQGLALERGTAQAAAKGAASDALAAGGAGETPARSERVTELLADFAAQKDPLQALARRYLTETTRAETHFSKGELTRATVTAVTEPGFRIDSTTEF